MPSQPDSVADPVAMQLLAEVEEDQNMAHQQLPLQQNDTGNISIKVQVDDAEQSVEHESASSSDSQLDENRSPNVNRKRSKHDDVELEKSSKKHASSEGKFRTFKINWNKISDNILTKLNSIQDFKAKHPEDPIPSSMRLNKTDTKSLVNNIVDQLRVIDSEITAKVMETVAKQLLSKFPCLEFVDDDGCGNGLSYITFKDKMIQHNNYLNRFKASEQTLAPNKGRHVRAGTLKAYWRNCKKDCDKDVLSKLRRDEPELLTNEFLAASQAFIRYKLNECNDVGKLLTEYPVLRRRGLLNYHFLQATGVNVEDLHKYYFMKRTKIIHFSSSAGRNLPKLGSECCDMDVFRFLACLVGENINDLILKKEIGTRIEDIHLESAEPLLVSVDMGEGTCMLYVYADHTRITEGTTDVVCALQDLMCAYYVHNYKYLKSGSKFLELVQKYFLKITPLTGSKSNAYRVGNQQRIVQRVIETLSNYDCK